MKTFLVSDITKDLGLKWLGADIALTGVNLANRCIAQQCVLSYCTSASFLDIALANPKVGAVVVPPDLAECCQTITDKGFIISDTPEWTFYVIYETLVSRGFFDIPVMPSIINNAVLGEGVVIEDNVVLGRNVIIGHHSIIKRNTSIGDNTIIGNCCIIGDDGFQIIYDPDGRPHNISHVGKVRIGKDVNLADCVTINKSLFDGETFIADNVKIGSHTHLAHNVYIGENSVITSFVNMFGSSSIGKNVWVAPNTAIMNKVHIGDGAFIGAASLVLKDIMPGAKAFGHPAKEK